jgi:hypothetical protein
MLNYRLIPIIWLMMSKAMINLTHQSNYFSVLMAISHELNLQKQDYIPDILKFESTSFKSSKRYLIKARSLSVRVFIKKALVVSKTVNFKSPHTITRTSGLLRHGVSNHD